MAFVERSKFYQRDMTRSAAALPGRRSCYKVALAGALSSDGYVLKDEFCLYAFCRWLR